MTIAIILAVQRDWHAWLSEIYLLQNENATRKIHLDSLFVSGIKTRKKNILYVEPLVWFTFCWWSEARFRFDVQATEVTLFGSGDGTGHKYSDRRVVPVQGDWMESGGFDLCIVYRSSWVGKYDKPKSAQSSLALLSRLYRPVGWGASQLSLCFIQFH